MDNIDYAIRCTDCDIYRLMYEIESNSFQFDFEYHLIIGELYTFKRLGIINRMEFENIYRCLSDYVYSVRCLYDKKD